MKTKRYEQSVKEHQQEFGRLIDQNTSLEILRPYIAKMTEKCIQRVKELKAHYAKEKNLVSPDYMQTTFVDQWITPFINSPHFPIQGTDPQTVQLKKQLRSAFIALFRIELMHDEG